MSDEDDHLPTMRQTGAVDVPGKELVSWWYQRLRMFQRQKLLESQEGVIQAETSLYDAERGRQAARKGLDEQLAENEAYDYDKDGRCAAPNAHGD